MEQSTQILYLTRDSKWRVEARLCCSSFIGIKTLVRSRMLRALGKLDSKGRKSIDDLL